MKELLYSLLIVVIYSCNTHKQVQKEAINQIKIENSRVAADYVSRIDNCFILNIRFYATVDGQEVLIANQNVQVGACSKNQRVTADESSYCKAQVFKGDYFYAAKNKYRYCLVELLQDDVRYAKYIIEKDSVIASIKK